MVISDGCMAVVKDALIRFFVYRFMFIIYLFMVIFSKYLIGIDLNLFELS